MRGIAGAASATARKTAAKKKSAKQPSLTEQVYHRLRGEILSCKLEPGLEISETELAERFEVSKTPVREALATLRQEGLVRTFPRRGYQITPITFGDMNELFDLRIMLEAGAAELACERISEDELAHLRMLADVVYDHSESPTLDKFIAANTDFHLAIARASGNQRLYDILGKQLQELERFFYIGAQKRDVNNETNKDHMKIVEALARRDRSEVRALMIRHNELTRDGLFKVLTKSRNYSAIAL